MNNFLSTIFFWKKLNFKERIRLEIALALIIVILSPIIIFSLQNPHKASAAWYDENWAYRQAVTVTVTSSSSDITNLETLITVNTSALISTKLQSSCQDLRFTSTNGKLLPYYIDSGCNTTATKIWVMVDLVPKSTTTYTMNMYYGNPSASAGTDANTFWRVKNLAGYWTLNDTSGNRTDSSVNADTLTDNNTVTSATGQFGNAGQFTLANNEYLSIADNASLSTGDIDFSLSAWVYMDSTNSIFALAKDNGNTSNREYFINYNASRFAFNVSNDGSAVVTVVADSLGAPSTGTWYFIVAWHDSVANTINIQVNNGTVDSVAHTTGVRDGTAAFDIGANSNNTPGQNWDGRIDDVRLYKRVLTSYERSQLYTNPGTIATAAVGTSGPSTSFATEEKAPGPIAYWKFDDGTGTTAKDTTTNANNGTLGGTTVPTWQTEDQCISGKCLFFDGSTSKVTGSKVAVNVQTVSFWIRPNTIASQGILDLDGGTHKINTNASGVISAAGFTSPTYYINGVATATPTLVLNQWNYVSITTGTGFNSTSSLTIGTDGTNFIKGFIDDAKLYSFARSAAQVKQDYNASLVNAGTKQGGSTLGASTEKYLSDGLVGYWKMDESSGSRVDSSGNGNTLTDNNTVTSNPGKFGNAGQFTRANSEYLSIADNASLSTGDVDFSVAYWVYFDSLGVEQMQVAKGNAEAVANLEYYIWIGSGNTFSFVITDGSNVGSVGSAAVTSGQWYFVVAWHDSVANTINIQVNNGAVESTAYAFGSQDTSQAFNLGRDTSGGSRYLNGRLDDVRFYKRVLSSDERTKLYNFAPGPVGYWNFEEGSGSSANDTSGNGYTGTITGATYTSGKFGKGMKFTSSNDNVSTSTVALGLNAMTAEAWVYATNTDSSWNYIVSQQGPPAWNFSYNTTYGLHANFYSSACTSTSLGNGTASTVFSTNTWNHAAVTRDSSGAVKLYLNGVQIHSFSTTAGALCNTAAAIVIGKSPADAVESVKGTLDDVRIYNYDRTSKQIVADMNASHPNVGSPVGSAVGWWKFDEGYSTTAYDSNALANNLTLSSASWTQSGKFGKAWNGTGALWASRADDDDLDFAAADDFTISFWFKSDSATNPGAVEYLINKASATVAGYAIYANTSGNICFGIDDDTTWTPDDSACSAGDIYDATWHYITAYKTSTSRIDLYVDGYSSGSDTSIAATGTLANSLTFYVGDRDGIDNGDEFNGDIDELKIYRYALTADEVKLDMNRSSSLVLGATSDNSSYQVQAANQEYCIPGDSTSCAAPVGRWNFEEGTGTTVNDSSGNAVTGTWAGTGSHWTFGKVGKAGNFNGTDDVVTTGTSSLIGTGTAPFTADFWIYPTKTLANGEYYFPIRLKQTTQFFLAFYKTGGTFYIYPVFRGATQLGTAVDQTTLVNKWNHVAVIYNGGDKSAGSSYTTYINGAAIAAGSTSFGGAGGSCNDNAIGSDADASCVNNAGWLQGKIDDVRVYNYARSAQQVAWDYNHGGTTAWWKMDECQGTTINDSAGNSNTGFLTVGGSGSQTTPGTCLTSSTPWGNGVTGKLNYSLKLDGTDDYICSGSGSCADNNNVEGGTQKTISFWTKPTDITGTYMLVEKQDTNTSSANGGGPYFVAQCAAGIGVAALDTSDNYNGYVTNTTPLVAGSWYHVVYIIDATLSGSNVSKAYINGVLQARTSGCTSNGTTALGTLRSNTSALYVGVRDTGGTKSLYFNGQMDDLRIYNYPLASTQVKTLYSNGAVNFSPVTGAP